MMIRTFSEFIRESAEPWRLAIRPGSEEGWTVVALVGGERVGELRFIESRFRRVLKATSVVVDPAWQGRGIARSMYRFAEERLGKGFVRTDAVLTPDGRALWQSLDGQVDESRLRFVRSPRAGSGAVPFGREVRFGAIAVLYNKGLGALEFRAQGLDQVKETGTGYLLFFEPGRVELQALQSGQEVAVLSTVLGAKEYQEWVLSPDGGVQRLELRPETPPAGVAAPDGKALILIRSERRDLSFDSSAETLTGVSWAGGLWSVPVGPGSLSLAITVPGALVDPLNFGMLADGSGPALRAGEVRAWTLG